MTRPILLSLCIAWGADALDQIARRRTIPKPPTECPDCRPAIRTTLALARM